LGPFELKLQQKSS
jgi:hypothetical protein